MTEHGVTLDPDAPPPEASTERITEPATPAVEAPPALPNIGFLVNCGPAMSPAGPELRINIGIGNAATAQQFLAAMLWVPEDQAEALGEMILANIRRALEEIRRARMGAPSGGLALPGMPGFGMPPNGPPH